MSYESVRQQIHSCIEQADGKIDPDSGRVLLEALDELTVALEADLTQIKAALSHVAYLLEDGDEQ